MGQLVCKLMGRLWLAMYTCNIMCESCCARLKYGTTVARNEKLKVMGYSGICPLANIATFVVALPCMMTINFKGVMYLRCLCLVVSQL